MAELRWNPLLGTWTMVASNRQNRPNLNPNYCPFCVGSGKVPKQYDVFVYANDFPALSDSPPEPDTFPDSSIYKTRESYGKCEVILFSSDHTKSLWELPLWHLRKVITTWIERFEAMAKDPRIQYIYPFENRGEAVGVTMHHPHGQIYGYPFIPLKLKTELDNAKQYWRETGVNLFEAMISEEKAFGKRIITENEAFIAFLPFFTDYPYGVFIVCKTERDTIAALNDQEQAHLADILQQVTGMFDALFDKRFPYMLCMHQSPVNNAEYSRSDLYYRFHIEFYPPLRSENAIKYYAGSEMGAWAAANTRAVEDTAEELREALRKFRESIKN
jgi:UDPglucose--hexose-1-phosphate uridylyltransferase